MALNRNATLNGDCGRARTGNHPFLAESTNAPDITQAETIDTIVTDVCVARCRPAPGWASMPCCSWLNYLGFTNVQNAVCAMDLSQFLRGFRGHAERTFFMP